jgi:BirA family transcriptional regulator, biotin operon repressor / biotin---[acetyl-CoA-carboxylase] ligase
MAIRFGEPLFRHEIVSSTQDIAKEQARAGAVPGTTITAQGMTAGRGRQGRVWITPAGCNVCLTTIGPPVPLERVWEIGLVVGTAVGTAVRAFAPFATVRFPNDVYLAGRKVAGILIETVPVAGETRGVVPLIGIGVNVRQPSEPIPQEIAKRAVSLEAATGQASSVPEVEAAILARLGELWEEWQSEGFARIVARWTAMNDPTAERNYRFDGEALACRVTAIAEDGAVTLQAANGDTYHLHAAQVILGDD